MSLCEEIDNKYLKKYNNYLDKQIISRQGSSKTLESKKNRDFHKYTHKCATVVIQRIC